MQLPVVAMMGDLESWEYPVWIANDTLEPKQVSLEITDADTGESVFSGEWTISANASECIGGVPGYISDKKVYLLRWQVDGREYGNHFLTGAPGYAPEDMKRWLKAIQKLPEPFETEM